MNQDFARTITRDCPATKWSDSPLLVFASCDVAYLGNAKALIRSLDLISPGFHFLLHVVNAGHEVIESLEALAEELQSTQLHITAERVALRSPEEKRTYYACARLIRLAEILPQTTTPIFVMDADGLFVAPIDLNFSDKAAADICLPIRNVADEKRPLHLRVAAGGIWARPTSSTSTFFGALANELLEAFQAGEAKWFIDQELLAKHVLEATGGVVVLNIKKKYVDWDFRSDAIVWTGKGKRKHLDLDYLLLRSCFDCDPDRKERARRLWSETRRLISPGEEGILSNLFALEEGRSSKRFAIYLPRLDLPWKEHAMGRGGPIAQSQDAVELRLWWKRFTMGLSHVLTRNGFAVTTVEIPAWDITPERVDEDGYDFAFIPHRCNLDFQQGRTPIAYYMQEYFRHVFVVDPNGWSAASSVYPVDAASLPASVLGAWDEYRVRFAKGEMFSKFGQVNSLSRAELVDRGQVPASKYAFFPLQIPHDQSLLYFSDVSQMEALDAVLAWAERKRITLVLKEHPANRASTKGYREKFGERVFWSDAHVHDLIRYAQGVVTLNSGVGFEAIIIGKPVVTLARAEYDAVSHQATLASIAEAWEAAVTEDEDQRLTRYSRFVDWFLARHAVDLSRPQAAAYSMDRVVSKAIRLMDGR